jgi:hypothetical protein
VEALFFTEVELRADRAYLQTRLSALDEFLAR